MAFRSAPISLRRSVAVYERVPLLIDTDVAIHIRDDHLSARSFFEANGVPALSATSLTELEGGAASDTSQNRLRRPLLDVLLRTVAVLPFTAVEAAAYGRIVAHLGFNRRLVLDRMIAAQAIVAGLPLVTFNRRDFADIPGLDLRIWSV